MHSGGIDDMYVPPFTARSTLGFHGFILYKANAGMYIKAVIMNDFRSSLKRESYGTSQNKNQCHYCLIFFYEKDFSFSLSLSLSLSLSVIEIFKSTKHILPSLPTLLVWSVK
jgi:hypothetical protein